MAGHIEPIIGYRIHQSIKLTLHSPKFNMFQNGLAKIKPATFDARKDRFLYRNITSKLNKEEVIYFFLANCLAGNNYPLANFEDEGMGIYKDFLRRKESLSYLFESELTDASLEVLSADELYARLNGNPPLIVSYFLGGIISLESLCLIQLCITDVLGINYDDYIWRQKKDFIKKVLLFFENGAILYDKERIKKIYKQVLN